MTAKGQHSLQKLFYKACAIFVTGCLHPVCDSASILDLAICSLLVEIDGIIVIIIITTAVSQHIIQIQVFSLFCFRSNPIKLDSYSFHC